MATNMRGFARALSKSLWLLAIAMSGVALAAGPSGEFLSVHPELKADPDRPGALVWQKPGFERARYTKVRSYTRSLAARSFMAQRCRGKSRLL